MIHNQMSKLKKQFIYHQVLTEKSPTLLMEINITKCNVFLT